MQLVGLAGKARSGKDTVADIWQNERAVKRYAFADPLRNAASAMFGLPPEAFSGKNPHREETDPFWGFSPRRMLQLLGTECGREVFAKDIWIKNAQLRLDAYCGVNECVDTPLQYFLVTDIRFEEEAEWVRKNGGKVIHVLRDLSPAIAGEHVSENGVQIRNEDYGIINNGAIDKLKENVQTTIMRLEAML